MKLDPDGNPPAPDAETHDAKPRTRAPRKEMKNMEGGIDPGLLALMKSDDKNGWTDNPIAWIVALAVISQFFDKDKDKGGVRDAATVQDLMAAQNAITERTLDITRDQATNALRAEHDFARVAELTNAGNFALSKGQCDLGAAMAQNTASVLAGQRDLASALADCCCKLGIAVQDTKAAVELCCCETQNAIAMQTATLQKAICDEGRATRDLLVQQQMDALNRQLSEERDANSNLRQTAVLQQTIREQCGHHWPWWGNGGGPPGPPFQGQGGGPA